MTCLLFIYDARDVYDDTFRIYHITLQKFREISESSTAYSLAICVAYTSIVTH